MPRPPPLQKKESEYGVMAMVGGGTPSEAYTPVLVQDGEGVGLHKRAAAMLDSRLTICALLVLERGACPPGI